MKKLLTLCLLALQVGQSDAQDVFSFGKYKKNHATYNTHEMQRRDSLRVRKEYHSSLIAQAMNGQLMEFPQAQRGDGEVVFPALCKNGTWRMVNWGLYDATSADALWQSMHPIYDRVAKLHTMGWNKFGTENFDRDQKTDEYFWGIRLNEFQGMEDLVDDYKFRVCASTCLNPLRADMVSYPVGVVPTFAKKNTCPDSTWAVWNRNNTEYWQRVNCITKLVRTEYFGNHDDEEDICTQPDSSWKKSWRSHGIRQGVWYYRTNCVVTSKPYHRSWFGSNWGYFLGAAAVGTAGVVAYNMFHENNTPQTPPKTYTGGPVTPPVSGNDTSYTGGPTTGQLKTTSTDGQSSTVATAPSFPKQFEAVGFLSQTKMTTSKNVPNYTSKIGIKAGISFGLDDLVQGKCRVTNFYLFPSRF